MKRAGMRGKQDSGIDDVVPVTETYRLLASVLELSEDVPSPFQTQDTTQNGFPGRIHACCLQSSLKLARKDILTNSGLRTNFGLKPANSAMASCIMKNASKAGAVKSCDTGQG